MALVTLIGQKINLLKPWSLDAIPYAGLNMRPFGLTVGEFRAYGI